MIWLIPFRALGRSRSRTPADIQRNGCRFILALFIVSVLLGFFLMLTIAAYLYKGH